jgi:hypothetical protein
MPLLLKGICGIRLSNFRSFIGCQHRSEKLGRVRGTARNMGVFNTAQLGENRGIERIIPKIERIGVLKSGCQTPETKPQMVRLEGGADVRRRS